MDRQKKGQHGESAALRFLQRHNLELLETNFHTRWGEIDLVMRDGDSVVFVEVRYRGNTSHVDALTSIDARKQQKLCRSAAMYLSRFAHSETPARFDVVAISESTHNEHRIQWIRNAFDCG